MATLADLQAELAVWKACRDAILFGAQSYSIAGRSLTRASLAEVRDKIDELETRISRKSNGPRVAPVFLNTRG